MSHKTLKYLGLLALAVTLFYWKTLLTNQFTVILGSEGVNLTYGWLHFWVRSVRHWHLPLWDPYAFAGRPFYGEILPSAFSPLQLFFALFPLPSDKVLSPYLYHLVLGLTHLLGTYFMFALLREMRCSRLASFVGACAFSMGGLISRMMWPPYVETCIWLPAIFLFLLRAVRSTSRKRAIIESALSGLCMGMSILIGGLHFFMMQGIFIVAAVLFYGACGPSTNDVSTATLLPPDRKTHWKRIALILGVFLVVCGASGAVQLLPAYQYSNLTVRFIAEGAFPSGQKIPYHRLNTGMWPQSIFTGLFPMGFNGAYGGGEVWPYYIGALPFLLAIVGIWQRWRNLWVRFLTGLAVVTFIYTLSQFMPLHGIAYVLVPFLWAARVPSRFLYLVSFALAVLAALGLDAIIDRSIPEKPWAPAKRILKWIAIVCGVSLFIPAVFSQVGVNSWTILSLLYILVSCAFIAHLLNRPASPWISVILACFVLLDLSSFNWLEADKSELNTTHGELEQMVSLGPASSFIKAQPGLYRTHLLVPTEPNIGDIYAVPTVWGGGATVVTNFMRLRAKDDLLNVRYLIRPASATEPGPVYQDAHWKVYVNPNAYPRAWIVHQTILEPYKTAIPERLNDPTIDLRKVALIEAPLPKTIDSSPDASDSVQFSSYKADRMLINVSAPTAGLLVLSEIYYPGWQATVNSKPANIYRVDGGLRAILVPAGQSKVVLNFVPIPVYAGGALSLLAFIGVFAATFLAWREGDWRLFSSEQQREPELINALK